MSLQLSGLGCGLVISTSVEQLMVPEARTKVRKLIYSTFGLDKIVLHALSPACNEVSSGFPERGSSRTGEPYSAKAWSTRC